ncbi:transferase [Sphingobacterium sp. DK4209]|uniref:Transferase n=1 Tax=Sphingobacterium zhuxiongii TaxID=2662364 RepID=A0A5Q0Q9A6_9SPHI|nr:MULTISPECIES: putative sugar nucleotidyl transferase [unclassified Sphingobacterium]MVZ66104.1 transferase [Sphingobacterium sp. DK4209]QGA26525.1 transferase [Sphingobacterium sp. dk4302]
MPHSIVLYDNAEWRKHLLPFCAVRPVGNLRVGICTLDEKWKHIFHTEVSYLTIDYLQSSFPVQAKLQGQALIIRANVLPSERLIEALDGLQIGEKLVYQGEWVAALVDQFPLEANAHFDALKPILLDFDIPQITFPEDIFIQNKNQLLFDFDLLTKGRSSATLNANNMIFGDHIFVEEGAQVEGVSLNSLQGPIYIGKHARLEEGSFLRGYVAIGEQARVKIATRLYENVSIGPRSTIGGEVNNSVLWGDSAKGHDGYLGCSVLGEGCNLGAGSSNSNLKNNWSSVKLYDYFSGKNRDTGILKCGLMMGDYAMSAINSSFNTGTVIGVGAQLAISNFIPKFVPDFSWLTDSACSSYQMDRFIAMLQRKRNAGADDLVDPNILTRVFDDTKELRKQLINH